MSEWIGELQSALTREFGDKPNVATLATVDKGGAPRARTVVCRRVQPDGSVLVASDARSEKNEQVKGTQQAEVVFWLPTLREQYRLFGSTRVMLPNPPEAARLEVWRAMSDAARALFFWPSPGAKRVEPDESFPKAVDAGQSPPNNFEVIVVRPRKVEHLNLNGHPHRRRRWMLAGKWTAAAEVNP
ncbi:MAG TPA: pyridoxamine 5'-phosphate oxidase family protein [Humisphaera sp.]